MKTLKFLAAVSIFILFGFLGTFDRAEAVIYTMPEETYYAIKDSLTCHGKAPSDHKIAEYYLEHQ